MNNQEYEKAKAECWEEFNNNVAMCEDCPKICFFRAFDRAFALGKQEKDAETVIQGWVSRDKDKALILWESKPQRNNITNDEWGMANGIMLLPSKLFPDLTWESDPEEVELIINRKRNESRN